MSEDFSVKTLFGLVRAARGLLDRGDGLSAPLSDEQRQILSHAIHAWISRIVNAHMAPGADEKIGLRDLLHMAKACDAYVVNGDGHPAPISASEVGLTFTARQVLLGRANQHPSGDLVVEYALQTPQAVQARERANEARRNAVAEASRMQPAAQPAPVAPEVPPATVSAAAPVSEPAAPVTPVETRIVGDSIMFGPGKAPPIQPPEPAPVPVVIPDPTQPAPAAQPEAGQPQAQ
jgi:hypothetical protein